MPIGAGCLSGKTLVFFWCLVGKETVKDVALHGDCTSRVKALNHEFELSKVAERGRELCY